MANVGPDVEVLRAEADALFRAIRDLDAAAARRMTWNHDRYRGMSGLDVVQAKPPLEDVRDAVASEQHFDCWSELERYADLLRRHPQSSEARFESSVAALAAGDATTFAALLDSHRELATSFSPRRHGGSLWHYLAANGVENAAQTSGPWAITMAEALRDAGGGALVDAITNVYGGGPGSTALVALVTSVHPAHAGTQADLVRIFCDAGADPNGLLPLGGESADAGLPEDADPLRLSLGFRYPAAARALVQAGAIVRDLPSAAGVGDAKLVTAYLDPSLTLVSETCSFPNPRHEALPGSTAPHPADVLTQAAVFAAMAGDADSLDRLLDAGADINGGPRREITAIHEAAFQGHAETVHHLLGRGADPTRRDAMWDSTAIGWASGGGHDELVRELFNGPQVDIADAVELRRPDVVRRLLTEDPACVNGRDGRGGPLREAAFQGNAEIIALLLAAAADRTLGNDAGLTASDYATTRGHHEVQRLLNAAAGKD